MKIGNEIKKLISYPLTLCFFISVGLFFVLYLVLPTKELSEWENRYLAKKPDISISDMADGSYMRKYEDYVNDQLPFRDQFIKLKALSEIALFKLENNGIAKGKESYLFTKNTGDTAVFDKNIDIIIQFLSDCSNDATVAIVPNACGVLDDFVPTGFPNVDQEEKLDELYGNKSLLKVARVVDLKSVLKAHEDEYIYYRTDHHFTTDGAYYAYGEISENPVELSSLNKSTSDDFLGTLYAKYKGLNIKPDYISYYDIPVKSYVTDGTMRDGLYDMDKLSVFDKYGMFMWGNFGECDIESFADNGKKLIVFKDSYANSVLPFLTFDYSYIKVIDLRYYKGSVSELMDANKDSNVLFLYNFDFMNEDNHFYKLMK